VTELRDLTMQTIAGWSGLVAKGQLPVPFGKLRHETLDGVGRAVDVADKTHLAVTSLLSHGD
jgi:hypothetical protein